MQPGSKESLYTLISKAAKLNTDTIEPRTDESKFIAHTFLTRNILTSITIRNIIEPPVLELPGLGNKPLILYDPGSAYTLLRNLFESYVNMHYLLVSNSSVAESELKLLLWNRHYRSERSKMAEIRGLNHEKLKKEQYEVVEINDAIAKNEFYRTLGAKTQKSLMVPTNWSLLNGAKARAQNSGISPSRVEFMYKFLSNYAHSESYSIMQHSSLESPEQAKRSLHEMPTMYTEAFLILTLNIASSYYPSIRSCIETDDFLKRALDFWTAFMRLK